MFFSLSNFGSKCGRKSKSRKLSLASLGTLFKAGSSNIWRSFRTLFFMIFPKMPLSELTLNYHKWFLQTLYTLKRLIMLDFLTQILFNWHASQAVLAFGYPKGLEPSTLDKINYLTTTFGEARLHANNIQLNTWD